MMRPIPLLLTICGGALLFYSVLMWLQEDTAPEMAEQATSEEMPKVVEIEMLKAVKPAPKVLLNEDFKQSVRGIAQSFAQQSRFPATSMPIENEGALQKYIPNQTVGASLPFEGPDGEALRFGLRTNKFRYFEDEVIEIYVSLVGDSSDIDAEITVSVLADRKEIYRVANGSLNLGSFKAVINTKDVNTSSWPKELHLQAVAVINGQTMQVVETIKFEPQIASVKSVGKGTVEDDYLVIPVAIDTDAKGYFRVTGVLFSEATDKPLVHLEGKAKININNDTVDLKAQLRALQVNDDEGPYLLKHLWLEKMPGPPDYETAYGVGDEESYAIDDHSFEEYSDTDFEDPAAKRSLEFLNKIGGETHLK
mgnify:CR=1 FL=1